MTTTQTRPPIPAHQGGVGYRAVAAVATPGGAVFVLAFGLLIATIIANPNFGEPDFVIRFFGRVAPIAIAAMGQYFVIVSGEFDLSMGAVVTAQVVMAGNLIGQDEGRILPVTCLMLLVGVGIGLLNGLATTLLKVPSFIVTLGMMLALAGLVRYLTGGAATGNPVDKFREIGRGEIEGVPDRRGDPLPAPHLPGARRCGCLADAPPVRPQPDRRRRQPRHRRPLRDVAVVAEDPGVHHQLAVGHRRRDHPGRVRRRAPLGGPGLRVHRDHRRRARRRTARRRPGLGAQSAAAGAFALELLFTLLTVLEVESTWRDTVQGLIIIVAVAAAGRAWKVGRRPRRTQRQASAVPTSSPQSTPPSQGPNTGDN